MLTRAAPVHPGPPHLSPRRVTAWGLQRLGQAWAVPRGPGLFPPPLGLQAVAQSEPLEGVSVLHRTLHGRSWVSASRRATRPGPRCCGAAHGFLCKPLPVPLPGPKLDFVKLRVTEQNLPEMSKPTETPGGTCIEPTVGAAGRQGGVRPGLCPRTISPPGDHGPLSGSL